MHSSRPTHISLTASPSPTVNTRQPIHSIIPSHQIRLRKLKGIFPHFPSTTPVYFLEGTRLSPRILKPDPGSVGIKIWMDGAREVGNALRTVVDNYGGGEDKRGSGVGRREGEGKGEGKGEAEDGWSLREYIDSVSSSVDNGRCCLACQSGMTSFRHARMVCRSGRASRFSSQQRRRISHNSSTSPRCAAVSGLYGRTPCSMASLILSVSQPSYGTCPHSTYQRGKQSQARGEPF